MSERDEVIYKALILANVGFCIGNCFAAGSTNEFIASSCGFSAGLCLMNVLMKKYQVNEQQSISGDSNGLE